MFKSLKKELIMISFGVILFVVLMHFQAVIDLAAWIINVFMPVIIGFVIAFILNVPMAGLERLTIWATKGKITNINANFRRLFCLILTLVLVVGVLAVIIRILIPALTESAISLYDLIMAELPGILDLLRSYNIEVDWINNLVESFNIENVITSTVVVASSAVAGVVEFVIGFIVALYTLMSKDHLGRQADRFLKAFMKDVWATKIRNIAILTSRSFSKFLSGQCLDASILGVMIFIVLSLAGIPYADLISVMTVVCAFVPYVGAFLSFTVGALLVVIVAPHKILLYVLLCLAVQFVESQFLYPCVVGNSVGMKPIWTLIAVIIGGKLFGLLGMIFFIPLMAVIVTLFSDYTDRVLNRKENFSSEGNLRWVKDDYEIE